LIYICWISVSGDVSISISISISIPISILVHFNGIESTLLSNWEWWDSWW
jgi:hypothetical protein